MPGGVGSNPDGVPTRTGTKILRAFAVALTRDKDLAVGLAEGATENETIRRVHKGKEGNGR